MRLSERNEAIRKGRVTASKIAALLPCGHPYSNPAKLYAELAHGVQESAASRYAAAGHLLEPVIWRMGRDRQSTLEVRQNSMTYAHPTLPIAATLDGIVLHDPGVVEVKLVFNSDPWRDRVPPHIVAQVQTQMLCTGRVYGLIWAFHIESARFEEHRIEASPEWQEGIEYAVWSFFRDHVEPMVPPPEVPDDMALTVYRPAGQIVADDALQALGDAVVQCQARVKLEEEALQERRDRLARAMVRADARKVIGRGWTAAARETKSGAMAPYVTARKGS